MILRQPTNPTQQARSAFTLMEMLVVVAIIVALAGVGGYYFIGAQRESLKGVAIVKMKTISAAVQGYMNDHATSPPGNLQILLTGDDRGHRYLKSADALKDPWGADFQYDSNTQKIWCNSPFHGEIIGDHGN